MFGAPLQIPNRQVCGWEETWPFKTVFVLEALLLQMPSYGYWLAVSISKGLNLGRGSACVFTDSPLDPPAQCRWIFLGSTTWHFLSHNSQVLLRNVKWLSYCVQPRQRWRVARTLACAAQQSCHVQRQKTILPLPSRSWQCDCLKDNDKKAIFLHRFELFKAMVLNQGSPTLLLGSYRPAEFSSNPAATHLSVIIK